MNDDAVADTAAEDSPSPMGHATIQILPDFADFEKKLSEGVASALEAMAARIRS